MKPRVLLAVVALGCSGGSAAVLTDHAAGSNETLTGAWDVTLTLERPYPLGFSTPAARQVCGMIGFVDDIGVNGGHYDRDADGVYRIPLSLLGLDWLDDSKFPTAIARRSAVKDSESRKADSVAIVLNPESQEHIELRGVYRTTGINGKWTAQSARGTASGQFTLQPHATGTSDCFRRRAS